MGAAAATPYNTPLRLASTMRSHPPILSVQAAPAHQSGMVDYHIDPLATRWLYRRPSSLINFMNRPASGVSCTSLLTKTLVVVVAIFSRTFTVSIQLPA